MRILITSAASDIAQGLTAALKIDHDIRLTERTQIKSEDKFVCCPLDHDYATNLLVQGMEAIIHVAEPLPEDTEEQQINHLTRGTYNLLWACAAEGVPRLIYLSTLDLMSQYDNDFIITERWRPRPTTEAKLLSKYLGESVCREFAREHKVEVIVLRLGQVVKSGTVPDAKNNPTWVAEEDVTQAVNQALTADIVRTWSVIHILAETPQGRFPINQAKKILGYSPLIKTKR